MLYEVITNVNLFHARNENYDKRYHIRPHELEIVSSNDKNIISKAQIKYIQLAGSQVKIDLSDIENSDNTIFV